MITEGISLDTPEATRDQLECLFRHNNRVFTPFLILPYDPSYDMLGITKLAREIGFESIHYTFHPKLLLTIDTKGLVDQIMSIAKDVGFFPSSISIRLLVKDGLWNKDITFNIEKLVDFINAVKSYYYSPKSIALLPGILTTETDFMELTQANTEIVNSGAFYYSPFEDTSKCEPFQVFGFKTCGLREL